MSVLAFLALALAARQVHSWTFAHSPAVPRQCTPITITPSGGSPPYQFSILRVAGNVPDLPVAQWGNGSAIVANTTSTYTTTLPWAQQDIIVIIGSDSTGFASGGTTAILPVQPSSNNDASCLAETTNTTFNSHIVSWEGSTAMCGQMNAVINNVANPYSVAIVVPGGQTYKEVSSSQASSQAGTSLSWTITVPQFDPVVFFAADQNGPLFVSPLIWVDSSDNGSCLAGLPAATETNPPIEISTSGSAPSETSAPLDISTSGGGATESVGTADGPLPTQDGSSGSSGSSSSSSSNKGAIAGGVVGGIVGLLVVGGIVMFLMRQYNRHHIITRRQTFGIARYGPGRPTPALEDDEVRLRAMGGDSKAN
ncbi:hypothetical protein CALCODRAFT_499830 [Calocera cornea HHB12733]|uniref:Mid2 domain-containing protein n=1 Tax=Calocera cornea HHB12733 TaxID=1353952 RepID=A0A165EBC6_9BASI|nr:hypothetical protein CALCODRAFT_499830 [Calocera cornea HHB12733]